MGLNVPHRCPVCCGELIDTPEGRVPGFYGRVVFPTDKGPHTCPNCEAELVPVNPAVTERASA